MIEMEKLELNTLIKLIIWGVGIIVLGAIIYMLLTKLGIYK